MIKQAPRPAQIVAMIAFVLGCFAVLLYAWIQFGGVVPIKPQGYRVQVDFPEATQLALQADVRISGVPVGKVIETDLGEGNRTTATLELDTRYSPIPKNSRAILRQKTLLGDTFVDLTQGDPESGTIEDNGRLPRSAVAPTVELDEIFRTFDEDTQQAFQTWMQSQSASIDGRGADVNSFFGNLPGFIDAADDLVAELNAQAGAVTRSIDSTGQFFDALSERSGQLGRLITSSNQLFQTIAARNEQFADIWREFPEFERQSTLTMPRLTEFARNADPVVQKLQPAASEMSATFIELKRLSPVWETFFKGLGPTIDATQKGVPALERFMQRFPSLLASFEPFLRNFNPSLGYLDQNRADITSFFGNATASTLARDFPIALSKPIRAKESVNYLRTAQTLSPEALTYYPRALGMSRRNAYTVPGGMNRLPNGLASYGRLECSNGNPAPPASSDPPQLAPLVELYAFRTTGRDVLAPPCIAQGTYPGFGTEFPQLRVEP